MEWFLDTHNFVTRTHCGVWSRELIVINQLANFLIFLAYFTIPLSLMSLWRDIRTNTAVDQAIRTNGWIVLMFSVFIVSCGLTHLMDVLSFSWAPYRLFTVIDIITAVTSVPTAFLLPGVLRTLITVGADDE